MIHDDRDVVCKEKAPKCRRGGGVAFDVLRRLGLQHGSQDPGHSPQEGKPQHLKGLVFRLRAQGSQGSFWGLGFRALG